MNKRGLSLVISAGFIRQVKLLFQLNHQISFDDTYILYTVRKGLPETVTGTELFNKVDIFQATEPGVRYGHTHNADAFEDDDGFAVPVG